MLQRSAEILCYFLLTFDSRSDVSECYFTEEKLLTKTLTSPKYLLRDVLEYGASIPFEFLLRQTRHCIYYIL